jgi:hypothetical protein
MAKLRTVGQVLARARTMPWSLNLYVPRAGPCLLDSRCVTLEPGAEDDAEVRDFLIDRGLVYGLSIATVQRIVERVGAAATAEQRLEALCHYLKTDTFLADGG